METIGSALELQGGTIEALIIRIVSGPIIIISIIRNPQNSIGNYQGPYTKSF